MKMKRLQQQGIQKVGIQNSKNDLAQGSFEDQYEQQAPQKFHQTAKHARIWLEVDLATIRADLFLAVSFSTELMNWIPTCWISTLDTESFLMKMNVAGRSVSIKSGKSTSARTCGDLEAALRLKVTVGGDRLE
eukprot:GABV01009878.1.p2 GENE.GABV01009878.1~~GABV01009878.1.p2  ORF type:complete len:133 (+),score=32.88 GABV01009878.1:149-547(+)